jgi:sugar lactone lactonase YvrE
MTWMSHVCLGADLIDGQPQMTVSGGTANISFSVKEYTDVTVEVVNAQDQVLRHLGSGVLGANAPLPFQSNSKSQLIAWDLKDNQGNVVNLTGVKILVRAGLKPSFERTFGWTGQALGVIKGMCVDKDGNLYVTTQAMPVTYRVQTSTKVFDRDGNYKQTILPFPASLPASKLTGLRFTTDADGRKIPVMTDNYLRDIYNMSRVDMHQPVILSGGKLIFPLFPLLDKSAASVLGKEGSFTGTVGVDGSVSSNFFGQRIATMEAPYNTSFSHTVHPRVFMAPSPDERYLYAGGVVRAYDSPQPGGCNVTAYDNCLYRTDLQSTNAAVPFIGTKFSTTSILSNPLGVDVDADGNIYVCDYGHNRIAVFDPQGTLLSELPIESPIQVAVHPSGKIYVYSADRLSSLDSINSALLTHKIIRLAGKNDATKEVEIAWPSITATAKPCIALDKHSEKPIIWIGSFAGQNGFFWYRGNIRKIVDNGTSFQDLGDVITSKSPDPDFGRSRKFILVDPKTDEVWWDDLIFDGKSGSFLRRWVGVGQGSTRVGTPGGFGAGEPRLGPNNSVIFRCDDKIMRYKRDGSRYPFSSSTNSATTAHILTFPGFAWTYGGDRNYTRGIDVDDQGNIYTLGSTNWNFHKSQGALAKFAENGTLVATNLVAIDQSVNGLAVDKKGAVYVGSHLKNYGYPLPTIWQSFFAQYSTLLLQKTKYENNVGSVLKFSPSGGSVLLDSTGTDFQAGLSSKITTYRAQGVQWSKFITSVDGDGNCNCETPDMETDGHNRVFVPEPLTYSISVYDENGNKIMRFGEYGNMDSGGPTSLITTPTIPITYAYRMAVSDKAVYINDVSAQRVAKVKLDYQQTISLNADGSVPADTTAPNLSVTSPGNLSYVTDAAVTLAGTSFDDSGILSVKVNGTTASTSDGFAHWSCTTSSLVTGTNQLTVIATDKASPANSTTITHYVIYASGSFDGNGDGMADLWQIQNFGLGFASDPSAQANADPDRDGATNAQEYAGNTNPLDPKSRLMILSQKLSSIGDSLTLEWTSVSGKLYTIEYSADLINWQSISTPIAATSSIASWIDNGSITGASFQSQARRFYRIKTSSP